MTDTRGSFTEEQVIQLLAPIRPERVLADGKGKAHVSQQDITAHLTRVFGFGNWDTEVISIEPIFEKARDDKGAKWDVCYRAMMRLTVRDPNGRKVCSYEDGSTGMAQNQTRGDAHDLAMKSAISLALKRCAKSLGDQFGLSLYNKGQRSALVLGTLVHPGKADSRGGDVQEGVPQQVSLGTDETAYDHGLDSGEEPSRPVAQAAPARKSRTIVESVPSAPAAGSVDLDSVASAVESTDDVNVLRSAWTNISSISGPDADRLRDKIMERKAALDKKPMTEAEVAEVLDAEIVEAS